jgi:hypothetical protein
MTGCGTMERPVQQLSTDVLLWQQSTEVLSVKDVRSIGTPSRYGHSREVIRSLRQPYTFASAAGCSG